MIQSPAHQPQGNCGFRVELYGKEMFLARPPSGKFGKENHILHGVLEGAEVPNLSTKDQVTQLRVGKKDDEEHDSKATNVFGALMERRNV